MSICWIPVVYKDHRKKRKKSQVTVEPSLKNTVWKRDEYLSSLKVCVGKLKVRARSGHHNTVMSLCMTK